MYAVPDYFSLKPYSQGHTNGCRLPDTKLHQGSILGFILWSKIASMLKKHSNVKILSLCNKHVASGAESSNTAFAKLLTSEIERSVACIEFWAT